MTSEKGVEKTIKLKHKFPYKDNIQPDIQPVSVYVTVSEQKVTLFVKHNRTYLFSHSNKVLYFESRYLCDF